MLQRRTSLHMVHAQAPPKPTVTLPLPLQDGHDPFAARPEPPHSRQMASPVPGVPSAASSPGLIASGGLETGCTADFSDVASMSSDAPGSSSPATDWLYGFAGSGAFTGFSGIEAARPPADSAEGGLWGFVLRFSCSSWAFRLILFSGSAIRLNSKLALSQPRCSRRHSCLHVRHFAQWQHGQGAKSVRLEHRSPSFRFPA